MDEQCFITVTKITDNIIQREDYYVHRNFYHFQREDYYFNTFCYDFLIPFSYLPSRDLSLLSWSPCITPPFPSRSYILTPRF